MEDKKQLTGWLPYDIMNNPEFDAIRTDRGNKRLDIGKIANLCEDARKARGENGLV